MWWEVTSSHCCGAVHLVLSMKNEHDVDRPCEFGVWSVVPGGACVQHVQEVF